REQRDLSDSPLAALLPLLEASAPSSGPPLETEQVPIRMEKVAAAPAPVTAPAVSTDDLRPETAGTVRIPAEKLDALLAGSGELLVARRRVQARAEELAALRESVGRWKTEWRAVEKAVARIISTEERKPLARNGTTLLPRRLAQTLGRT